MPQRQSFFTSLNGFGAFSKVISKGKKLEENPIKAFICSSVASETILRAGFTTAKSLRKASERNHLKRLMKEAFRLRRGDFSNKKLSNRKIEVVFMYVGNSNIKPKMVKFWSICKSIESICSIIRFAHVK